MKKQLYTLLIAVVEDEHGYTHDIEIARHDGDVEFSKEEIKQLSEKFERTLYEDEILCDVFEDIQWLYY